MRYFSGISRISSSVRPILESWVWAAEGLDVYPTPQALIDKTTEMFTAKSLFVGAASNHEQCHLINCVLPEISFAGRSNVGKSSLLNGLMGTGKMVKTSRKPGHTKGVNYFSIGQDQGSQALLVDLPGYGYARGSKEKMGEIHHRALGYALGRTPLLRAKVFLLIDCRRGLMPVDVEIAKHFDKSGANYCIVLTKADLVPEAELHFCIRRTTAKLGEFLGCDPFVHVVSTHANWGLQELRQSITRAAFPILGEEHLVERM